MTGVIYFSNQLANYSGFGCSPDTETAFDNEKFKLLFGIEPEEMEFDRNALVTTVENMAETLGLSRSADNTQLV